MEHIEQESNFLSYLVANATIAPRDIDAINRVHNESSESKPVLLLRLGLVSQEHLVEHYAKFLNIPTASDEDLAGRTCRDTGCSSAFMKHQRVCGFEDRAGNKLLAMQDPEDDYALEAMEYATGEHYGRAVATGDDILAAIDRVALPDADQRSDVAEPAADRRAEDIEELRTLAGEAPMVRLVQSIVTEAVDRNASDIHIEPMEDRVQVRFRIDGVLVDIRQLRVSDRHSFASRIKVMARLDIAESRLPQDGRIRLTIHGRDTDFRVVTSPVLHGESIVLRILDRRDVAIDFEQLGFSLRDRDAIAHALANPHGIVLVTGPTGSGKTTTLYGALQQLNQPERKILTAEDPIEYTLQGVNQVQVRPQIGFDFAQALRSFLRQDPDVMMVGEIRDAETARIAVQAALTGHLLLSTLHTNSAAGAVVRLMDMGIEPFLIASTLNAVIGQRLVRRLCNACKQPAELPSWWRDDADCSVLELDKHEPRLFAPKGCPACNHTGYSGRIVIAEVFQNTPALHELIMQRASTAGLARAARDAGMKTLRQDGLEKAAAGLTSVDEVIRITSQTVS